jgi:hypothetical protein
MLLDHRTHLEAKAKGENSMFGKAKTNETAKKVVRRGPVGMAKAVLPEPQCPLRKIHGLDTAEYPEPLWSRYQGDIQSLSRIREVVVIPARFGDVHVVADTHSKGAGQPIAVSRARKGRLNRPERQLCTKCGIAYRGRPPRQRRLHSSLKTGKPSTWRRESGRSDELIQRYA